MKKIIITTFIMWVSVISYSQTLNLVTGSTFATERQIFQDNTLSNSPIPFFQIGLGYTHHTNISVSITYAFDLKQVNLISTIPLWSFKKNKWDRFALINNNKLKTLVN